MLSGSCPLEPGAAGQLRAVLQYSREATGLGQKIQCDCLFLTELSCSSKMFPSSGSYEGEMSSWTRWYFVNNKIQCKQALK